MKNIIIVIIFLFIAELVTGNWLRNDPWREVDFRANLIRSKQILFNTSTIEHNGSISKYTKDDYGLRKDCEDNKKIQIVAIGGSTTDQKYIDDSATWSHLLELKINKARKETDFCVANAGSDGHKSSGHIYALSHWFELIPNFHPKYYLLYVGINDAPFSDDFKSAQSFNYLYETVLNNSSLVRTFKILRNVLTLPFEQQAYIGHKRRYFIASEYKANLKTSGVDELITENTAKFGDNLKVILDLIKQRDGVPICVSQPTMLQKKDEHQIYSVSKAFKYRGHWYNGLDFKLSLDSLNQEMNDLCINAGGYYIDMASQEFDSKDFYNYVHMNKEGSQKLSDYLGRSILKIIN